MGDTSTNTGDTSTNTVLTQETLVLTHETLVLTQETPVLTQETLVLTQEILVLTQETLVLTQETLDAVNAHVMEELKKVSRISTAKYLDNATHAMSVAKNIDIRRVSRDSTTTTVSNTTVASYGSSINDCSVDVILRSGHVQLSCPLLLQHPILPQQAFGSSLQTHKTCLKWHY